MTHVETRDADLCANFAVDRARVNPLPGGVEVQTDALAGGGLGTAFRGRKLNAYLLPAASVHTVVRLQVGSDTEGRWVDFILPASSVAYERRAAIELTAQESLRWEALTGACTITTYFSEE